MSTARKPAAKRAAKHRRRAARAAGSALDAPALVTLHGIAPTTDSRRVAEHFGRRHDTVLRAFDALQGDEDFCRRNFVAADELDAQGKPRRIVRMTKDGFALLAMGFTGPKALAMKIAYINAFNAMAERLQRLDGASTRALWNECLALERLDASSFDSASHGSLCLHARRRALPLIESERRRLMTLLQPTLFVTFGDVPGQGGKR